MAKKASTMVQGTSLPGWLAPVAGVCAVIGLGGAFLAVDAYRKIPPNTSLAAIGIGALVLAAVAALVLVTKMRRVVIVDAKGVEVRSGSASTRILWSEPHELFYRPPDGDGTGAFDWIRMRTADGRSIDLGKVVVPDQPNAAVPRVVERHSTSATYSHVEAELEQGEAVRFGPVTVDGKSFEVAGHSFPMDGTLCIQVAGGKLRVGSKAKWTSTEVPVVEIANFQCLLRAIGQVSQARPPG